MRNVQESPSTLARAAASAFEALPVALLTLALILPALAALAG
jgi:hypothetical protein